MYFAKSLNIFLDISRMIYTFLCLYLYFYFYLKIWLQQTLRYKLVELFLTINWWKFCRFYIKETIQMNAIFAERYCFSNIGYIFSFSFCGNIYCVKKSFCPTSSNVDISWLDFSECVFSQASVCLSMNFLIVVFSPERFKIQVSIW